MEDRCEHCEQPVKFDGIDGMWHHVDPQINTHQAKLDLRGREQGEMGPTTLEPEEVVRLRCNDCGESVTPLETGGYIHNYTAIGDKLRFVHPEVIEAKDELLKSLVCSSSFLLTATSGSYDSTHLEALDKIHVYKAVNAAMIAAFYQELEANPGLDWADIRHMRERKRCGCLTCSVRESDNGDE